jgi:hypothetical protein
MKPNEAACCGPSNVLARIPEQPFEFTERGNDGWDFRAKFFGDWLVRYWIDAPVKVVVIVDCRLT